VVNDQWQYVVWQTCIIFFDPQHLWRD